MEEIASIPLVRSHLAPWRARGQRVALVPTMGALHEGHLQLVRAARSRSDLVVMSIFVNPLQFGAGEDFDRYPRELTRDRSVAERAGVDLLFVPTVAEMYPEPPEVRVVAGTIGTEFEGGVRPGHFDGVLTVVTKLLHIVQPGLLVLGQKDIQQVVAVRRLLRDLDLPVDLMVMPTWREPDGLAMSSRNVYLSADQRERATALSAALRRAAAAWQAGERDPAVLRRAGATVLAERGCDADYIAVLDPETFAPAAVAAAGTIVALAVRLGSTRLIDNIVLGD